jgi:hypothetical protein
MECTDSIDELVDEGGRVMVVYKDKASVDKMTSVPYVDEDELQSVLEEYPELLQDVDGPPLRWVGRGVALGDAGFADLLFLDAEGHLTVVEVKLARNPESRREVLAQVFDYTSALAEYTIDELDDEVKGELDVRLRELAGDDERSSTQYDRLWKSCADSMRAGSVRVVVAMDDGREDLARIVRFVNEHSDLDVCLLIVRKYSSGEKTVLVPEFTVRGGGTEVSTRARARSQQGTVWDEETFLAEIEKLSDKKAVAVARDLLEFTKGRCSDPWKGGKTSRPRFGFYFKREDRGPGDFVMFAVIRDPEKVIVSLSSLDHPRWGRTMKSVGLIPQDYTRSTFEVDLDEIAQGLGLERFKEVVENVVAGGFAESQRE